MNSRQRNVTIAIAFIWLAALSVAIARCEPQASYSPTVTMQDESKVEITVAVTSNDSIEGALFTLGYDHSKIRWSEVRLGDGIVDTWKIDRVNDNGHFCAHEGSWITVLASMQDFRRGTGGTFDALVLTFQLVECGETNVVWPSGCTIDTFDWVANAATTNYGFPLTYGPPYNNLSVASVPVDFPCIVGIEEKTWQNAKGLYR